MGLHEPARWQGSVSERTFIQLGLALLCGLMLCACAAKGGPPPETRAQRPDACTAFLDRLDSAVQQAEVRDASSFDVHGFPYLRTDRFLAAQSEGLTGPFQKRLWLELLLQEHLQSRRKEVSCLPMEVRLELAELAGVQPGVDALLDEVEDCSRALLAVDILSPEFYPALAQSVTAPEEYSLALRAAGVYPLTSLPVAWLTARAHDRMRDWHKQELGDFEVFGELVRYAPRAESTLPREAVREMLEEAGHNALGLPRLEPKQVRRLAEAFAPIILQDVVADYDSIGRVRWQGEALEVEGDRPTLYYYVSYAFFRQQPVLQINYAGWYPGRQGPNAPFLEKGDLDGFTVRVSLDGRGRPFMVDIMNNCGCYHFFVPARDRVARIKAQPLAFDAFVPTWLPEAFPDKGLVLRMNTGWHQVQKVTAGESPGREVGYTLLPYRELEMLPSDGRRRSMFDARGIAKGSERIEPVLLFGMGIPEVGAMRQRNRHALRLVGRAHFANPWLFERYFEFVEE